MAKLLSKIIDICFYILLIVALFGVLQEAASNIFKDNILLLNYNKIYNIAVIIASISPAIINLTYLISAIINKKKKEAIISLILFVLMVVALFQTLN